MKYYVVPTLNGYQAIREGHRRGMTYTTRWSAARGAKRRIRGRGEIVYLNTSNKIERVEEVW